MRGARDAGAARARPRDPAGGADGRAGSGPAVEEALGIPDAGTRAGRGSPPDRLPATIEATAYFVVAEALTNVAKHSRATSAAVAARVEDGTLRVEVRDDGGGGARPDGSGLQGLRDRLRHHRRIAFAGREPGQRRDARHGGDPHPGKRYRAIVQSTAKRGPDAGSGRMSVGVAQSYEARRAAMRLGALSVAKRRRRWRPSCRS